MDKEKNFRKIINNKKIRDIQITDWYTPIFQFFEEYLALFLGSVTVIVFGMLGLLVPIPYSQIRPSYIPEFTDDFKKEVLNYFEENEDFLIQFICGCYIALAFLSIIFGLVIYFLVIKDHKYLARSVSYGLMVLACLNFMLVVYFILRQRSILYSTENTFIRGWQSAVQNSNSSTIIDDVRNHFECNFNVTPKTSATSCIGKILLPTWQISFVLFAAFLFMALLLTRGIQAICVSMHLIPLENK